MRASLFTSRLQARQRRNVLSRALRERGKLIKRLFILHYLGREDYRRRIHTQLNKGEALHALRQFLFLADEGVIRRQQEGARTDQAMGLNMPTNAVAVWNTICTQSVLDQLRTEGYPIRGDDLLRVSPARS